MIMIMPTVFITTETWMEGLNPDQRHLKADHSNRSAPGKPNHI